ncbi:hypothetical protein [Streptomyces sp. NPDC002746]
MPEPATDLAVSAATVLVTSMATDAWAACKNLFVRWLRRHRGDEAEVLVAQLERGANLVARAADQDRARAQLAGSWQLDLADLLDSHPELEGELREILAEIGTQEQAAAWYQTNVARDQGTVFAAQGGNVIHHSVTHMLPAAANPDADRDMPTDGGS